MPARIDDYVVLRLLGRGGQGEVYAAQGPDGASVAIKLLHPAQEANPENRTRLEREIGLAAGLRHPNVVPLLTHGHWQGRRYLVAPLVAGEDLAQRLARRGRLAAAEALSLLAMVADGLAAIHAAGLVHRDLKPANILIDDAGVARIIDLGLARRTAVDRTPLTVDGMLIGTPHYMAPEQIASPHAIDGRADCYALGVVLYRCLSGCLPFEGETSIAILRRHLEAPVPVLQPADDGVPSAVAGLCARLLAKDPGARPDAVALAERLRDLAATCPAAPAPHRGTTVTIDPVHTPATAGGQAPLALRTRRLGDGELPGTLADGGIPGTLPDGAALGTLVDDAGATIPATLPDDLAIPATLPDQPGDAPDRLVLERGGHRLYLYAVDAVVCGRDARERGTDLCLRLLPGGEHAAVNRRISGRHLEFSWDGAVWTARDLHSTGGSVLDARRLAPGVAQPITGDGTLVVAEVLELHLRPRGEALWIDRRGNAEGERYLLIAAAAAVAPDDDGLLAPGDETTLRRGPTGLTWSDGAPPPAIDSPCPRCGEARWRAFAPGDQK